MPRGHITQLLVQWREGDRRAVGDLFHLVSDELHALAHRRLARCRPGDTLNTTALVHEAYVRFVESPDLRLEDRGHFFNLAARAMRQILVDYARRRAAVKRGGAARTVLLDEACVAVAERAADVVALDAALERLGAVDARLGQLVELRFFGGLSLEEAGGVLRLSTRTLKRDWRKARAFLYQELSAKAELDAGG